MNKPIIGQETRTYDEVAERVLAAVHELNAALAEAYEHPEVRVHAGMFFEQMPAQVGCEVTRITKHKVTPSPPPKLYEYIVGTNEWRVKP